MSISIDSKQIHATLEKLTPRTQAYLSGAPRDALGGATFTTINPATGQPLADVAACDSADVDLAVAAAQSAFDDGRWSRVDPAHRKRVLLRLAELIEANAMELAVLETIDTGKPISDSLTTDLPETINSLAWHAELADKLYDRIAPTSADNVGLIYRQPIGVVGAILPWNFPLMLAAWKIGPALAAGNSLIVKPAEQSPLSTLRLAELVAAAGVPEGVFHVLPGYGETVGRAMGLHPGIGCISFTGSTQTGRALIQAAAGSNLKRIILECGGKSPCVVLRDVSDLDAVAAHATQSYLWNQGENCTAGCRLIVHESVKELLFEKIRRRSREWVVGDPLDPATRIGALIEQGHLEKVLGYIHKGREEGATLRLGGGQVLAGSGGYFVEPTIFDDVDNRMAIARDEIFGPVLAIIPFRDADEALRLANDTAYGLAASLWTDDLRTAHRFSRELQAGTVSVNCYSEGNITTPFGGFKLSGYGGKDNGIEAHDQYTLQKTVWIQL